MTRPTTEQLVLYPNYHENMKLRDYTYKNAIITSFTEPLLSSEASIIADF
ncbi:hypothetical protein EMIT036CA2_70059 [Chryseobacterium sp. IT-36CA2]